jgi:hypothetical protein
MDFDRLPRELDPPRELEDRTVAALRRGGLLRSSRRRVQGWVMAAASLLLFLGGVAAGRALDRPAAPDDRPRFVLLLMDSPAAESTEAELRIVEAYRQWARSLRDDGRFVSGARLDDRSAGVPAIREGAEKLEGYFVISASSFDEAVSVAKTCPHAARGGRIVVRPVAPT